MNYKKARLFVTEGRVRCADGDRPPLAVNLMYSTAKHYNKNQAPNTESACQTVSFVNSFTCKNTSYRSIQNNN